MTTINNGVRERLIIDGIHDGSAGFTTPKADEVARGADVIAAFVPNDPAPRRRLATGMTARTGTKTYTILSVTPSVAGLVVTALAEVK